MKLIRILASAAIAIAMILSAVGCDRQSVITYQGIEGVTLNEKGELIVTYNGGFESNLGTVKGQDGVDGKDGLDGKDGVDGKDGLDGVNGQDGKNGLDGKDGINGQDGKDGQNGADGKDGLNGKDGKDGKDGVSVGEGNTIVINGGDANTVYATAKGILSSVSIICKFTGNDGDTDTSGGSGVIYKLDKASGDAFIITNYHVVYSKDTVEQISQDINVMIYGAEYADYMIPATFVGGSMNYDIAVLRIEDSDILKNAAVEQVEVADSNEIVVGQSAIAIGNAEGMGISATLGSICVDSEYLDMLASDEKTDIRLRVMRMDTAVNHGNSGGGLFDGEGKLIGIVSAKLSAVDVEGFGYAIPSKIACNVADNIIDNCFGKEQKALVKPTIGVEAMVHEPHAELDENKGTVVLKEKILVTNVVAGGLAESAGILKDDIIVSVTIGGEKIEFTRQYQLIDSILTLRVGDSFITTVERKNESGDSELVDVEITVTADSVVYMG